MTPSTDCPPTKRPNPFYLSVLQRELEQGKIRQSDRILVACGGYLDRVTLLSAGFSDVLITNLAPHGGHQDYRPFAWEHEDIERLSFADGSFDVVIVHSGLHHCHNPMRALGEMCRVTRKSVLAFEPYETWLTRLGSFLGYGQRFEDQAVHGSGGKSGGVANTEIPNFVFRFREGEVRKFAWTFRPYAESPVRFYRALRVNTERFRIHRNPLIRYSFALAIPFLQILARAIPSLNNNLCFVIQTPGPEHFHPWIDEIGGEPHVRRDYLEAKYGKIPE